MYIQKKNSLKDLPFCKYSTRKIENNAKNENNTASNLQTAYCFNHHVKGKQLVTIPITIRQRVKWMFCELEKLKRGLCIINVVY